MFSLILACLCLFLLVPIRTVMRPTSQRLGCSGMIAWKFLSPLPDVVVALPKGCLLTHERMLLIVFDLPNGHLQRVSHFRETIILVLDDLSYQHHVNFNLMATRARLSPERSSSLTTVFYLSCPIGNYLLFRLSTASADSFGASTSISSEPAAADQLATELTKLCPSWSGSLFTLA